jgi:hypothetical protein
MRISIQVLRLTCKWAASLLLLCCMVVPAHAYQQSVSPAQGWQVDSQLLCDLNGPKSLFTGVQMPSRLCRVDCTNIGIGGGRFFSSKECPAQPAECPVSLERGSSGLTFFTSGPLEAVEQATTDTDRRQGLAARCKPAYRNACGSARTTPTRKY